MSKEPKTSDLMRRANVPVYCWGGFEWGDLKCPLATHHGGLRAIVLVEMAESLR